MVSVVKHSGEVEEFDIQKVEYALIRSGTSRKLAKELAREVKDSIFDGITTSEVYKLAFKLLKKRDTTSATRFGLKLAIMRLGPTGFPFEKYVSRILREHGFKTEINQTLKGVCVDHEVDVVAEKDDVRFMVECKYHNQQGFSTGLKEALYTQARFQDLVDGGHNFNRPWIMCNTKCSETAIKYGEYKGMKFTSWGYPPGESLQDLIEGKCLYPVTILRKVTNEMKNRLANRNLMLVQDLIKLTPGKLSKATGKSIDKLKPLLRELQDITPHTRDK